MSLKKFLSIFAVLMLTVVAGCQTVELQDNETHRELVVYSNLNSKFVNALIERFSKDHRVGIKIMSLNKLDGEKQQADVVLSDFATLDELTQAGSLSSLKCPAVYKIHHRYRGNNNTWSGVFYDPMVLLISREYSRKYGQTNLHNWQDLCKISDHRIVLENFNNSKSQQNLFAAFASNMGEDKAFAYFQELNKYVVQYTKFPFTPVRMITSGEADFAITLNSYVYEYLDNDFPAYTVEPNEGTPIILYGVGIFKGSDSVAEANQFVQWLLTSSSVKAVAKQQEMGFKLLSAKSLNSIDKLWINYGYTNEEEFDALMRKWYEKVRFGGKKWSM